MNRDETKSVYKKLNRFHKKRKRTLRYHTINSHDILYDKKVVFIGTLTPDRTKPADCKALFFIWENINTVVVDCTWKDGRIAKDSMTSIRVLKKALWQLGVPQCLSSVKIKIKNENGNEQVEPFWELGEQLEKLICYKGQQKGRKNEGTCIYYHKYSPKKIAKQVEFKKGKLLKVFDSSEIDPKGAYIRQMGIEFSKQFYENGQPKYSFEKTTFTEFFEDGGPSCEVRKLLENGVTECKRYYPSGILKTYENHGEHGYYAAEYYENENLKFKVEELSTKKIKSLKRSKKHVHYETCTHYYENGKIKKIGKKFADGVKIIQEYYKTIYV